jgi:3-methyladenine DNA glycosylase Tag
MAIIPERINPTSLDDYLEIMTKAVFQAGLRWSLIDAKWPAFRKAFADFDTHKVAAFTDADVERIAQDPGIIRSAKKIQGTIENAREMIALEKKFGSLHAYFVSFENYEKLSADIRKRFAFMGEMSVYYFLFRVREQVPDFDTWITTIPGHHPRMREMVEHAAKQDAV